MNEHAQGAERRRQWVLSFMRQKQLQQSFQEFWDTVQARLRIEMERNGEQLQLYLQTPTRMFNKQAQAVEDHNAEAD